MSKSHTSSPAAIGLDAQTMRAANVNPDTGLATDYLNHFNEYIMLAALVIDGSMEAEILREWQPLDYESHFVQSGFAGVKTVLAAYRALPDEARIEFEDATNELIDLVLSHQETAQTDLQGLERIKESRDHVAAMISTTKPRIEMPGDDAQAAIDALFD